MKDTIKLYFETMLEDGFDLEASYDNLVELIEEIYNDFKEEVE